MSIQKLEAEVKRLSPSELAIFSIWFGKFAAPSVEEAPKIFLETRRRDQLQARGCAA